MLFQQALKRSIVCQVSRNFLRQCEQEKCQRGIWSAEQNTEQSLKQPTNIPHDVLRTAVPEESKKHISKLCCNVHNHGKLVKSTVLPLRTGVLLKTSKFNNTLSCLFFGLFPKRLWNSIHTKLNLMRNSNTSFKKSWEMRSSKIKKSDSFVVLNVKYKYNNPRKKLKNFNVNKINVHQNTGYELSDVTISPVKVKEIEKLNSVLLNQQKSMCKSDSYFFPPKKSDWGKLNAGSSVNLIIPMRGSHTLSKADSLVRNPKFFDIRDFNRKTKTKLTKSIDVMRRRRKLLTPSLKEDIERWKTKQAQLDNLRKTRALMKATGGTRCRHIQVIKSKVTTIPIRKNILKEGAEEKYPELKPKEESNQNEPSVVLKKKLSKNMLKHCSKEPYLNKKSFREYVKEKEDKKMREKIEKMLVLIPKEKKNEETLSKEEENLAPVVAENNKTEEITFSNHEIKSYPSGCLKNSEFIIETIPDDHSNTLANLEILLEDNKELFETCRNDNNFPKPSTKKVNTVENLSDGQKGEKVEGEKIETTISTLKEDDYKSTCPGNEKMPTNDIKIRETNLTISGDTPNLNAPCKETQEKSKSEFKNDNPFSQGLEEKENSTHKNQTQDNERNVILEDEFKNSLKYFKNRYDISMLSLNPERQIENVLKTEFGEQNCSLILATEHNLTPKLKKNTKINQETTKCPPTVEPEVRKTVKTLPEKINQMPTITDPTISHSIQTVNSSNKNFQIGFRPMFNSLINQVLLNWNRNVKYLTVPNKRQILRKINMFSNILAKKRLFQKNKHNSVSQDANKTSKRNYKVFSHDKTIYLLAFMSPVFQTFSLITESAMKMIYKPFNKLKKFKWAAQRGDWELDLPLKYILNIPTVVPRKNINISSINTPDSTKLNTESFRKKHQALDSSKSKVKKHPDLNQTTNIKQQKTPEESDNLPPQFLSQTDAILHSLRNLYKGCVSKDSYKHSFPVKSITWKRGVHQSSKVKTCQKSSDNSKLLRQKTIKGIESVPLKPKSFLKGKNLKAKRDISKTITNKKEKASVKSSLMELNNILKSKDYKSNKHLLWQPKEKKELIMPKNKKMLNTSTPTIDYKKVVHKKHEKPVTKTMKHSKKKEPWKIAEGVPHIMVNSVKNSSSKSGENTKIRQKNPATDSKRPGSKAVHSNFDLVFQSTISKNKSPKPEKQSQQSREDKKGIDTTELKLNNYPDKKSNRNAQPSDVKEIEAAKGKDCEENSKLYLPIIINASDSNQGDLCSINQGDLGDINTRPKTHQSELKENIVKEVVNRLDNTKHASKPEKRPLGLTLKNKKLKIMPVNRTDENIQADIEHRQRLSLQRAKFLQKSMFWLQKDTPQNYMEYIKNRANEKKI